MSGGAPHRCRLYLSIWPAVLTGETLPFFLRTFHVKRGSVPLSFARERALDEAQALNQVVIHPWRVEYMDKEKKFLWLFV
jgi:hypothetical protein